MTIEEIQQKILKLQKKLDTLIFDDEVEAEKIFNQIKKLQFQLNVYKGQNE